MIKNVIISYIRKLDFETAKLFALRFGIVFYDYEINIFLPYLQQNAPYLLSLNDVTKKIHIDLDNKINVNSVNKLCLLINKLGY